MIITIIYKILDKIINDSLLAPLKYAVEVRVR